MIKLPSGVEINNLIDDLRIFSWEVSEKFLYYDQILKDPNNKSNLLKNDNNEEPVTLADLEVNEIIIKRIKEKYEVVKSPLLWRHLRHHLLAPSAPCSGPSPQSPPGCKEGGPAARSCCCCRQLLGRNNYASLIISG